MYKKLILIIAFIIIISLIGYNLYKHYYQIDITKYKFAFLAHITDSPDEKYRLWIDVYKEYEESDTSYIMGRIYSIPANKDTKSKVIFWQKVKSDTLKHETTGGLEYDHWIDNYWVDSETVSINGIQLNIHNDKYDYRRHK